MSYHPDFKILKAYAAGELNSVDGFAVATHLENCQSCKAKVLSHEQHFGEELSLLQGEQDLSFDSMFTNIIASEPDVMPIKRFRKPISVEIHGKQFSLPLSLSRFEDKIGEWRSYGGKVFSAPIDVCDTVRINLLYIAEGVKIPQHTHKGIESTLILHGGFSDEEGHYEAGDYLVKDASDKHSPFTKADEDCLCLTVLTEPMVFTQGVARIFNLFGKGMYP
ncbi:transcriptional regulator [Vibrio pectenicida]|uniref:Transcriptional regulator n=1 Tax=Vibrio pectenicida TaxID=62763 RepID=A0A3R9G228_9VIBR|nr:ChrR family anti-sigma-E factor [Vibrio pectenicida]NOH72406.1 transcriptional regulator [Vibrio pectenicida]RSD30511.1 transcriptional regulator [Vibrio pectenicida]